MRVVKLDEWLGLPRSAHPATCEAYLRRRVLPALGIKPGDARYLAFDAATGDAAAECARVDAALARWGGIDVALLGLGVNGHLGLNEPAGPGDDVAPLWCTRAVDLAPQTRRHAMLDGVSGVTRGVTLGLGALLSAAAPILLVTGHAKAAPLAAALVDDPPSETRPASLLAARRGARVVCDAAARPPGA